MGDSERLENWLLHRKKKSLWKFRWLQPVP